MTTLLEICASDIQSVWAAANGGAGRVELCAAIGEGGLTPSYGLIEEAMKVPGIKVNVLIRPRGGDFLYSEDELRVMRRDIEVCRSIRVNGVVFGALTPDGVVDRTACLSLMEASEGLHKTFHRAFDVCRNPHEAVKEIISLGFDRVLTSGQKATAPEGASLIAALQKQYPGLTFIAASGISPANAAETVRLSCVREIHASAKDIVSSHMRYRHAGVSMGRPETDEYTRTTTSEAIVRKLVGVLKTIESCEP